MIKIKFDLRLFEACAQCASQIAKHMHCIAHVNDHDHDQFIIINICSSRFIAIETFIYEIVLIKIQSTREMSTLAFCRNNWKEKHLAIRFICIVSI